MLSWFGGRNDNGPAPVGARHIHPDSPPLWICGDWPEHEIATALAGPRRITIIGPCSASAAELEQLAHTGTTDAVSSAFAGAYTVIESTPVATVVYTDPGHGCPIYLARTGNTVLWGSSALALAALTGASVDERWLAAILAGLRPASLGDRSPFAGITAVSPGARLHLDRHGRTQLRTIWQAPTASLDLHDGAQALQAALRQAVQVRLHPGQITTADCSGGLDSTSLTMLAADMLDADSPVRAITIHPETVPRGGDLDYARTATTGNSSIRHVLCPLNDNHLPCTAMTELLAATDEPAPGTIAIARGVAEFDLLRELGSGCHLTGDGGDTLFSWHPAYLAEHIRSGRLTAAWREGIGWARLRRTPVWPVLHSGLRTAFARTPACRELPSWLGAHAQVLADEQTSHPLQHESGPIGQTMLLEAMRLTGRTAHADRQLAADYGIRVHNPFTDGQVLHAVLSTRTTERATPYRYKPLLTTAMTSLLPPQVAARQTKGDFTADHYQGLHTYHQALRQLACGELAERGLIEPGPLIELIDRGAAGMPVLFSDLEPVLAIEAWLRTLTANAPAAAWQQPTDHHQECRS
ncbi:asparagine synthase [Pseudonocardiaceae bacterium YIM PH 21723]|nr:asparagine synthase [Pseudonocardiaceae bacterium YIM PH 21723]